MTRTQLLNIVRQAQPVLAEFTRNRGEYADSLRSLVTLGGDHRRTSSRPTTSRSRSPSTSTTSPCPDLGDVLGDLLGIDLPLLRPGCRTPQAPSPLADLAACRACWGARDEIRAEDLQRPPLPQRRGRGDGPGGLRRLPVRGRAQPAADLATDRRHGHARQHRWPLRGLGGDLPRGQGRQGQGPHDHPPGRPGGDHARPPAPRCRPTRSRGCAASRPVGEQYLDFQPNTDDGPFLEDGATVSAEFTDLPKSLSSTVVAVNKVLRQIDDQKLRSFLVELSTGLEGTGDDIGQPGRPGRPDPGRARPGLAADRAAAAQQRPGARHRHRQRHRPARPRHVGAPAGRASCATTTPSSAAPSTARPASCASSRCCSQDAQKVLPGLPLGRREPDRHLRPARPAPAGPAAGLRARPRRAGPGDPRRRAQARADRGQGPALRLRHPPPPPARPHPRSRRTWTATVRRPSRRSSAAPRTPPGRWRDERRRRGSGEAGRTQRLRDPDAGRRAGDRPDRGGDALARPATICWTGRRRPRRARTSVGGRPRQRRPRAMR